MKVKSSQRAKKRYIVFEVVSNKLNNDSAIYYAIKKSAIHMLGDKYNEAGIRFLKNKYKPQLNRGIVRVNNKYARSIIEALKKDKNIKTLGMSGILKKAEEKYFKIAA